MDGELRDLVGSLIERLRVPGAAIAIVRGESEQVGCFGVTNIEHPAPIAPDTLFQVGSITRTVTATAAMRLMDAGRLDIDAPIRTYLPDFRLSDEDVARRVTLRHIFTHRAGWSSDHLPSFGEGDDAPARRKLVSAIQVNFERFTIAKPPALPEVMTEPSKAG